MEAWFEQFRHGRTEALAWLSTRPFTFHPAGDRSQAPTRSLEETLDLSGTLSRAIPGLGLHIEVVEEREHRVLVDAALHGAHTGPLDLSDEGLGAFASTGRGFRLPTQRLAWDIVHERVHRFEVVDGPGLGLDLILDRLGLDLSKARPLAEIEAEDAGSPQPQPEASNEPEVVQPVVVAKPRLERRIDHAIDKHRRLERRRRLWNR